MSHTPGPWVFGSFGNLLVVPVIDGIPCKYDPICDLGPQHFPSNTEVYANASLISAAPELLEALKLMLVFDSLHTHDQNKALISARAAIAKATGGES